MITDVLNNNKKNNNLDLAENPDATYEKSRRCLYFTKGSVDLCKAMLQMFYRTVVASVKGRRVKTADANRLKLALS